MERRRSRERGSEPSGFTPDGTSLAPGSAGRASDGSSFPPDGVDLEPDRPGRAGEVEHHRVVRRSGSLRVLLGAGIAFFLVAALKPWNLFEAPAPATPHRLSVAAATATPATATPAVPEQVVPNSDAAGPLGLESCLDPESWLVVDDDIHAPYAVRTWTVAATTTQAVGPEDPRIPVTQVVSRQVLRLGFCAPPAAGVARPGWHGTLWLVGRDDETVGSVAYDVAPGGDGTVLRPPDATLADGSTGTTPGWAPGHYILDARIDGGDSDVWLAIDIVATG